MLKRKKKAFTLAEILITLSIIGIVAAISIPSLLVNINDKTYDAQRNALLARMSQAVGQMDDIGSYEKSSGGADQSSAVTFITKGLSKVYKISSVCGKGHLDSCDVSATMKLPNATSDFKVSENETFSAFNDKMSTAMDSFDTNVAAFMTTNGESILVYYNPKCKDKHENDTTDVLSEVCVNMIYDLNGGKSPNQFGKDIGFMTIMYPSTPTVVAPVVYSENISDKPSFSTTAGGDASSACSTLNGDLILPDRESLVAMVLNKKLIGNLAATGEGATATTLWSATVTKPGSDGKAWTINTDGSAKLETRSESKAVRCIKK